jgi:hypothetical protein
MATEFDNLRGLAAWRAKLDELLAAAGATAQKDDLEARLTIADRLTQFTINSPPALASDPASAEYDEMDRIARKCRDALEDDAIEQRVAAITNRTAELAALRKKFESQTTANQQSAASIRLERVRRVLESTTAAVTAMGDLKKELDQTIAGGAATPEVIALATQVAGLIDRLQAVRKDVGTAFPA